MVGVPQTFSLNSVSAIGRLVYLHEYVNIATHSTIFFVGVFSSSANFDDVRELERLEEDARDARVAATKGGNCRACFTASMSPRVRELAGTGECNRGGLGGGGLDTGILKVARGGGGNGPAVACRPSNEGNSKIVNAYVLRRLTTTLRR